MNGAMRMVAALVALGLALGPASARADDATTIRRTTVAEAWSGIAACLSSPSEPSRRSRVEAPKGVYAVALAEREARALRVLSERGHTRTPARATTNCTSSDCIAIRLFGLQTGPRLLRIAADYGFIATSRAPDVKAWTVDELDQILAALGDLPTNLMPVGSNSFRDLIHSDTLRGSLATVTGPMQIVAQSGDPVSGILIGQGWHGMSRAARRAVLIHEVAHEFARARASDFAWRQAWRAAMDSDAAAARGETAVKGYVSRYALNSIDEDFAEAATAYRYIPGAVRRPAPARYSLLREWLFDGLEYGAARSCEAEQAISETVLRDTAEQSTRYRIDGRAVAEVIAACRVDPHACAERSGFDELYRASWTTGAARPSPASNSALEAVLDNTLFVGRALIVVQAVPEQINGSVR